MAITVPGEIGKQLAKLQREAREAHARANESERAYGLAVQQAVELDSRLARLEGRQLAGHRADKEVKAASKALRDAREQSSDTAKREIAVLRAAAQAHAERVEAFIRRSAAEIEAVLREQAETIVRQVEEHIGAAAGFKDDYMTTWQSFSELLMITDGDTRALPSADGASSYFRDLKRSSAEGSLRVPAPREPIARETRAAA